MNRIPLMLTRRSKESTKSTGSSNSFPSQTSSEKSLKKDSLLSYNIEKSFKKTKVDDSLATTQLFLEGAQSALAFAPIPFIGEAVDLVLTLLGTVQTTRDNQSAFKQLSWDACHFTSDIVKVLKSLDYDPNKLPPRFMDAVKQLLHALRKIEEHASKQAKRGMAKRYLLNIADKSNVTDCEKAFQTAVSNFKLVSSLSTWAGVEALRMEQPLPARVASDPVTTRHNFSVVDNSRNHTYVTGPGSVIRRSTGLQVVMSDKQGSSGARQIQSGRTSSYADGSNQIPWTDSPRCASPIPESQLEGWLANSQIRDCSEGHIFDSRRGGTIHLQDGVFITTRSS